MRYASAAATLVVAALFSSPCLARQVGSPDSAQVSRLKQSLIIRPVLRRYSVDTTTVTEQTTSLDYSLKSGRTRLRLSVTQLGFSDGTTRIRGATPAELVADVHLGRLDTLRLTLRSPSVPGSLTTAQVSALGSVGTGTLDLESIALGSPAAVAVRTAFARPAGSVIVGLRLGLDVEPRPGGGDSVYWRGTTMRAGVSVTGFAGEFRITGGLDFAKSVGDSLAGRNLFPGGGSVSLRADASGLVGTNATLASFSAFYFRPVGIVRPLQANRLIPTGDFAGASATVLAPAGAVFLTPSLSVIRESSDASALLLGQRVTLQGSGLALAGSMGVDIPVGRRVSLMPEAGFVAGRVRSDFFLAGVGGRGGATFGPAATFSDPVSGWWTGLEISASF